MKWIDFDPQELIFWHTNVFKIELKECVIKCEIKIS